MFNNVRDDDDGGHGSNGVRNNRGVRHGGGFRGSTPHGSGVRNTRDDHDDGRGGGSGSDRYRNTFLLNLLEKWNMSRC